VAACFSRRSRVVHASVAARSLMAWGGMSGFTFEEEEV